MDIERCVSHLPSGPGKQSGYNRLVTDQFRDPAHIREISRISFTLGFFNQKTHFGATVGKLIYNVFATFISHPQKLKHFLNKSFLTDSGQRLLYEVTALKWTGNRPLKAPRSGLHPGSPPADCGCSRSSRSRRFHPPSPAQPSVRAPSRTRYLRSRARPPGRG